MQLIKPIVLFDIDYTLFDTAFFKESGLSEHKIYEEVIEVLEEGGIDWKGAIRTQLSPEMLEDVDRVIVMAEPETFAARMIEWVDEVADDVNSFVSELK